MAKEFQVEVIVVGGGHAGVEAAFACARRGHETAILTLRRDNIGVMSCNPAIGGLAKGQVVREIDALGGEMGKVTDATGIQFRMLNKSRGPAVWAPRAQADRLIYAGEMLNRVNKQSHLVVYEEKVENLIIDNHRVTGVETDSGNIYLAKVVILATGTFLNGLMHIGEKKITGGRINEQTTQGISNCLAKYELALGRLKTGTPPRIKKSSVNFEVLEAQGGDEPAPKFSFWTQTENKNKVSCWITYTNKLTHDVLTKNIKLSPMYSGAIKGIGPRYCPSVEDKIVRFSEKERHQIFLEPEGINNDLMYVNGFSTSMPEHVQEEAIKYIPGLENVEIVRYGYAVEYDFVLPIMLTPWLETKKINNLFLAGQINGTSGYEEAAGQGIIAGINAVQKIRGETPFVLPRSEAYIGVLIDDLVTKSTDEPYRLFTSRSENRLHLRQDNADLRLCEYGRKFGLINDEHYEQYTEKKSKITETINKLNNIHIIPDEMNAILRKLNVTEITQKTKAETLARRTDIGFSNLRPLSEFNQVSDDVALQVDILLKYDGYIQRQQKEIERHQLLEDKAIPGDFDYEKIKSLSKEAKAKLIKVRPLSLGQAGRIPGVTPADISVLLIAITASKRK